MTDAPFRLRGPVTGRSTAFTLVELLVVIGIIAVLIGILLPALNAARRQSVLTQCLAVQRQIGSAAAIHLTQHRGYYPIAGYFSGIDHADPMSLRDLNKQKYTYVFVDDINGTPWSKWDVVPWQAALAVNMGKPQAVLGRNNDDYIADQIGIRDYQKFFLCPAQTSRSIDAPDGVIYMTKTIYWTVQQSYAINEAIFGVHDYYGRLRGQASRISNPAQTIMLMDGLPAEHYVNLPGYEWITIVNKTSKPPITLADAFLPTNRAGSPASFDKIRHKGKVNVLFIDGHSETRNLDARDLASIYIRAPE